MERLSLKHKDTLNAINTLKQILEEPSSIIVRDATIQRFEYTFEALWKFLREYLKEQEGIICNSPKSCFREIFSSGLLTEEETVKFIEMADDRNLTSHTYREGVSEIIYENIPDYYNLMETLMKRIEIRTEGNNVKK